MYKVEQDPELLTRRHLAVSVGDAEKANGLRKLLGKP